MYWTPIDYAVSEKEDFETVKNRVIKDSYRYLELLAEGSEESVNEVIKSFTFSKLYGKELCEDEKLLRLSKEIRDKLKEFKNN